MQGAGPWGAEQASSWRGAGGVGELCNENPAQTPPGRRSLANETVTVDEAKAVYPFMAIGANIALVRALGCVIWFVIWIGACSGGGQGAGCWGLGGQGVRSALLQQQERRRGAGAGRGCLLLHGRRRRHRPGEFAAV